MRYMTGTRSCAKQHMRMRGTHIYTSTEHPKHPLHHLRSALARRPRAHPPHTTPAHFYQTELDSLPLIPENTSLRTHIHTVYTNRTLNTFSHNTILGTTQPSPLPCTGLDVLPLPTALAAPLLRARQSTSSNTVQHYKHTGTCITYIHWSTYGSSLRILLTFSWMPLSSRGPNLIRSRDLEGGVGRWSGASLGAREPPPSCRGGLLETSGGNPTTTTTTCFNAISRYNIMCHLPWKVSSVVRCLRKGQGARAIFE